MLPIIDDTRFTLFYISVIKHPLLTLNDKKPRLKNSKIKSIYREGLFFQKSSIEILQ